MAEYKDREHYIPLRRSELIEALCAAKGLSRPGREALRQCCRLVTATYHFEYHQRLDDLKNEHAPCDPDAVTVTLKPLGEEAKERQLGRLFEQFTWLMERANHKHLS